MRRAITVAGTKAGRNHSRTRFGKQLVIERTFQALSRWIEGDGFDIGVVEEIVGINLDDSPSVV